VHSLSDRKSQAGYDDYLHIGSSAVFDSSANAVIGKGMDALSTGLHISPGYAAAVDLIRASYRAYAATEEAINTRRSFLPLTGDGETRSNSNRVFAQLAH
jgi:hypothetical protein